jgi:hypothetical protein
VNRVKTTGQRKKPKNSSTWKFFKEAAADYLGQKAVRFLSVCSFVLGLGLVFGSNFIFHGGDHAPKNDLTNDLTEDEPTVLQAKTIGNETPVPSEGSRNIASVAGALRSESTEEESNPLSSHAATSPSVSEPPKLKAQSSFQIPSKRQSVWGNGVAPSNGNLNSEKASASPTTSQDQSSGMGGAFASQNTPSATASFTPSTQGTLSNVISVETNGHLATPTLPQAGFAIVAGGSLGTATGMQVNATVGQVTSPNIQNGAGVTLVTGLVGPGMVNF